MLCPAHPSIQVESGTGQSHRYMSRAGECIGVLQRDEKRECLLFQFFLQFFERKQWPRQVLCHAAWLLGHRLAALQTSATKLKRLRQKQKLKEKSIYVPTRLLNRRVERMP
jgi:hypothetical protein